jgi:hypothetical protein
MHDELGFQRYGLHGSDIGAGDTSRLTQAHPEAVIGIHLTDVAAPSFYDPAALTDEERLAAEKAWEEAERGCSTSSRPATTSWPASPNR